MTHTKHNSGMKKRITTKRIIPQIILLGALILLAWACKKDDVDCDDIGSQDNGKVNHLLLLKVDYLEPKFKGFAKWGFSPYRAFDSIPIADVWRNTWDFNYVNLLHTQTKDTIFGGGVVWLGSGEIDIPEKTFISPATLCEAEAPAFSQVQWIYPKTAPDGGELEFKRVWQSVEHLSEVHKFMNAGAKVGYFLYTPSVGVGDPNEWFVFLILYL